MRPVSAELEQLLGKEIPVLDKGFVRVIDYMGNDAAVVQAARVSYGQGTKSVSSDTGLIRYLLSNAHTSPFEMCELKVHMKLPIFVARQMVRHRTANINEYSGRYSVMNDEWYVPDDSHILQQDTTNKQGSSGFVDKVTRMLFKDSMNQACANSFSWYNKFLERGVSRETSRIALPLNTYTEWYWKCDLHNLLRFLTLRADSHAQYEVRAYAYVLGDIVKQWTPITYQAWVDYEFEKFVLSSKSKRILKQALSGQPISQQGSGLTKREWMQLINEFDLHDKVKDEH